MKGHRAIARDVSIYRDIRGIGCRYWLSMLQRLSDDTMAALFIDLRIRCAFRQGKYRPAESSGRAAGQAAVALPERWRQQHPLPRSLGDHWTVMEPESHKRALPERFDSFNC